MRQPTDHGGFATLLNEDDTAYEAIAADIRDRPHDCLRDAPPASGDADQSHHQPAPSGRGPTADR